MAYSTRLVTGIALCWLTLVQGLAGTPEEVVGKRALERWHALIQRDFEKAYGFLSPAYRRTVSLASYKSRIGDRIRWTDIALKQVACQEASCEVTLELGYKYASKVGSYTGKKVIKERWVHSEGGWWYVPGN